jgi:thioredoxin:protein disulfide reductase
LTGIGAACYDEVTMKSRRILLVALSAFLPTLLSAQFGGFDEGPAKPEIRAEVQPGAPAVAFYFSLPGRFHITDLKNGFFTIELEKNEWAEIGRVAFPAGVPFGEETVFKNSFTVPVGLKVLKPSSHPIALKFTISYQICQERPQELCFPPDQQKLEVPLASLAAPIALPPAAVATLVKPEPTAAVKIEPKNAVVPVPAAPQSAPIASRSNTPRTAPEAKPAATETSMSGRIERLLREGPQKSPVLLFLLVFVAGFLTSLTPCVYPVIPLVMGFVGARSGGRRWKGFTLSLFFVLGLALVYSLLGVVAAKTGSLMGPSFQNPWVVALISAIFIVMGLSLAGLFSITPPAALASRIGRGYRSEILTAMAVGGISGIIAAPCVGPVLIALLSWISQTGNVLLGFWLTFVFSLGMSVIFLLAGTFSGVLTALPRGGKWMETVKYLFATLLIAGGLYFLGTILPAWLGLTLWGAFLIAVAVWLGVFTPRPEETALTRLGRTLAVLVLLAGALLFWKGLERRWFPAAPTVVAGPVAGPEWMSDLEQAKSRAKTGNRRLVIDFYADWCRACVELDEKTWPQPEVVAALGDFVSVKVDFTRGGTAVDALKKQYRIIGMPTVVFLDPDGAEIGRFSGFLPAGDLLAFLKTLR